jgi:hypothetical protein
MHDSQDQRRTPAVRTRRSRGTGSVFEKGNRWYGQRYARGRLITRSLGPVRQAGTRDGLTKGQAQARLRELMAETDSAPPPVVERLTVGQVGDRLIKQLALKGRTASTTENYASYLRVHIEPHFAGAPISEISAEDVEDVEDFLEGCLANGLSVKSTLNYLGFLHGIFDFAVRKRWAHANPCKNVDKPEQADEDQEIHFLEQPELDALLLARSAPEARMGSQPELRGPNASATASRRWVSSPSSWLSARCLSARSSLMSSTE